MPNGGIIDPTNLTASGPYTPLTSMPSANSDMVLFTGPPKSNVAIAPRIAPIRKRDPPCMDSNR